jgi:hypothetical protein
VYYIAMRCESGEPLGSLWYTAGEALVCCVGCCSGVRSCFWFPKSGAKYYVA